MSDHEPAPESVGPEAPEPLEHPTTEALSLAEVAAEDTDEALRHEHEAVDRVEEAAAEQAAQLPAPVDPAVLDTDDVAPPVVDEQPTEDLRADVTSMLTGMPVPGLEPPA